jgi:hypothetical protein
MSSRETRGKLHLLTVAEPRRKPDRLGEETEKEQGKNKWKGGHEEA